MSALVRAIDVKKSYVTGDLTVDIIRGVTLDIHPGEFVSITGQSGSGKSTLLYLLTGVEKPTSGRIIMRGMDLAEITEPEMTELRRRFFSMVWQFDNLVTNLTIFENITLPLLLTGERFGRDRADGLMEEMGITHIRNKKPYEVSGGEQQRASIARALITEPHIIFLDEPTGSLDTASGNNVMDILSRIHREKGISIVQVTHSPRHAKVGTRIIRVADGRVVDELRDVQAEADLQKAAETVAAIKKANQANGALDSAPQKTETEKIDNDKAGDNEPSNAEEVADAVAERPKDQGEEGMLQNAVVRKREKVQGKEQPLEGWILKD